MVPCWVRCWTNVELHPFSSSWLSTGSQQTERHQVDLLSTRRSCSPQSYSICMRNQTGWAPKQRKWTQHRLRTKVRLNNSSVRSVLSVVLYDWMMALWTRSICSTFWPKKISDKQLCWRSSTVTYNMPEHVLIMNQKLWDGLNLAVNCDNVAKRHESGLGRGTCM